MEISIELCKLYEAALAVVPRAYARYSNFRVGAAVLCGDGTVITGVNVENRSFGLTNCAERSAIFTAISSGFTDFRAIAIATPDASYPVSPCGACRQVLSEFFPASAQVVFGNSLATAVLSSVGELYPYDALHELSHR